ncbi:hypothetical protein BDF14DRAFT_560183 [Spinellus fusiger]|nr:hypothetical protein BDF14DRAFT_560183 [Spinellus fusiger]
MQKRQFHQALFYLSAVALLLSFLGTCVSASSLVARQDIAENTINVTIAGHVLSIHGIIASVILFITGIYLCFAGGVHQRLTIFLVGFYVGCNVAYIILTNAKDNYGANNDTIFLVVTILAGVLIGSILVCCLFLAIYLLGALLGYMAALWLLTWVDNGLIQQGWGRAILIICFVIAGVILMAFLERPMIVIATAFVGSFAIFVGVDMYVNTGFNQAVEIFLKAKSLDVFQSSPQVRGMLAGTLGLALVGAIIQWLLIRNREHTSWRANRAPGQGGWSRV